MLPGAISNGRPRLPSLAAADTRFFSLSASRLARALARSSALELVMCFGPPRHHPRRRVIQYSRGGDAHTQTPRRTGCPAFAGHDIFTELNRRSLTRNFD